MQFIKPLRSITIVVILLISFFTINLEAQELFYFPPNVQIPDTLDGGLIIENGRYPTGGITSINTPEQFSTKEKIWANAPIILEGITLEDTRNDSLYYPGLKVSENELYYIIPYFVINQYKGETVQDTIYILQHRADLNYVYQNGYHTCAVSSIGSADYFSNQSFVFLQEKFINGIKFYITCDFYYDGFSYARNLNNYRDSECHSETKKQFYNKEELLELIEPFSGLLTERVTPTAQQIQKINNDKKLIEENKRREHKERILEGKKNKNLMNQNKKKHSEFLNKIKEVSKISLNKRTILSPASDPFTYTITKQECLSQGDSGKYSYSFLVFGKADLAARYFVQGTVYLNYNTEAFGEYILSNDKVTITKGAHFSDSTYLASGGDESSDVLKQMFHIFDRKAFGTIKKCQ